MAKNKYVMLIQETNWADELDFHGFSIMPQSDWNDHIDYAKKYFKERSQFSHYAGSNQDITFNSYDDWRDSINVNVITIKTAKELLILNNAQNRYDSGTFISPLDYDDGLFDDTPLLEEEIEEKKKAKLEALCQEEVLKLKNMSVFGWGDDPYVHYRLIMSRNFLANSDSGTLTNCEEQMLDEYNRILNISNQEKDHSDGK